MHLTSILQSQIDQDLLNVFCPTHQPKFLESRAKTPRSAPWKCISVFISYTNTNTNIYGIFTTPDRRRRSCSFPLKQTRKGVECAIKNTSTLVMPGFHHSVAFLPLPFRRSVLPFRRYRCRCGWERKCWKRLYVYIGIKCPERWLVVHLRQNGKIGFDPIATERRLRRNGKWKRQRRNGIFHVCNVILTALTQFLRNLRNGNGETATAERQLVVVVNA